MTRGEDYLYDLLPVVHRMRDEVAGFPLRELLRVVAEQVNVLEDDITRLYDNWFIETCDDWVVPYIGDLVGYRPIAPAGPATAAARRREVADTIRTRRRKGTLALLEDVATDVAAWPARAVESYALLGWTQHVDHPRPSGGQYVDLRSTDRLDRIDSALDDLAHRVDVRRPGSHRTRGRYNVPGVALHLWRLGAYPVTGTPAACIEQEGAHCYTFSVLGNDTPLFHRPDPARAVSETGGPETGVPGPIRRRAFEHRVSERPLVAVASTDYYGAGRSLSIEVVDWPRRGRRGVIRADDVVPADLSDWRGYQAPPGKVLVDPTLGRLVFAPGQSPKRVSVSYHYGFGADLGGGEYRRPLSQPAHARLYRVRQRGTRSGEFRTIGQAHAQWRRDAEALAADPESVRAAVIEVADSGVYEERLVLDLEPGESLQLRAAPRTRPVLRLLDYRVDQPDPFTVSGGAGARFVLDGFLVTGRGVQVAGAAAAGADDYDDEQAPVDDPARGHLCDVTIRHCTLVPGWELDCDCTPGRPGEPSLTLTDTRARVVVEHSILGPVHVSADERIGDPAELVLRDSIVDATGSGGLAVGAHDGRIAFVDLTVARATVVGEVRTHAIALAENSIFTGRVLVARRQVGCMRYSSVPDGSRTPPRYRCQPDVAVEDAAAGLGGAVDPAVLDRARARARERVRPVFDSLRYGTSVYGRLADGCPEEITRGADDESELGAFHDLHRPQRMDGLRVRLDEYTPAGMDAGIFPAT